MEDTSPVRLGRGILLVSGGRFIWLVRRGSVRYALDVAWVEVQSPRPAGPISSVSSTIVESVAVRQPHHAAQRRHLLRRLKTPTERQVVVRCRSLSAKGL